MKTIFEFLLWDNCNNCCQFCFQRKQPRLFSIQQQKEILDNTICFITSNNSGYVAGSHIMVCGGELFDDETRKIMLVDFFNKLFSLMLQGTIDLLYVNTNLLYGKQALSTLIEILMNASNKNILQRIKFTTSYDVYGRFQSDSSKQLFLSNLRKLVTELPNINIVANMILTKQCCEHLITNKFDMFNFMHDYSLNINLIPYIVLDNTLTPSRQLLFKTLHYLHQRNPNYISDWIYNFDVNYPRKMFYVKDDVFCSCECKNSSCGHSINFKRYSSNNSCFVCDVKNLYRSF